MTCETKDLNYRPDINGLRALAVLLVLLFHLEYASVQAGFLGVDVFLVISGYLISRNIINDLKLSRFSFSVFYIKRFKRLFPALFVTLSLSLLAGFFILAPANLEQLSKSVASGVFFYSNIFFLSETGYFDTESAFKPLLHIWSLSLEEQFYFVWPLLLLMIFKVFRKFIYLIILLLTLTSVCTSELYNNQHPESAFYLLPFRFFEFLLGALCIYVEQYKSKIKWLSEFALLSGLVLICYSAVEYTMLTPMPGIRSLVPCVGAMLVIYGGNTKYAGVLLRNRMADIIGKISYSVYLVHWPLIVYYKYYTLSELTATSKLVLGILSLLLGFLMWKYIENTFRRSGLKFWKIDAVWIWTPVLMVLLSVCARQVWLHKGYPSRYGAEFVMTLEEMKTNRERYWQGGFSKHEVLNGTDNKKVIIMGNSHSIDLMYALRKNGLKAKIVPFPTSNLCFNFGAMPVNQNEEEMCRTMTAGYLADTNWKGARAIYLFDNWPLLDMGSLKPLLIKIRTLSKSPIFVFGPKMTFTRNIPEIVHLCKSSSTFAINKFAQEYRNKSRYDINAALIKFFEDPYLKENKIYFINVLKLLENGEDQFDIISRENSKFLYFDGDHYTEQGAKEFGEKIKETYPEIYEVY